MGRNQKPKRLYVASVSLSAHRDERSGNIHLRVYKDIGLASNRAIYSAVTIAPIVDEIMSEMETAAFTEWERECAHLFGSQPSLW